VFWKIAQELGILKDRRQSEKVRGGGIVLLPVILWYVLNRNALPPRDLMASLIGVVALIGLLDDIRGVSGYLKAAVTLAAVLALLWAVGWVIPIRTLNYEFYVPIFNEVFWTLFFVGFVNAFNVIDGEDGVLLITAVILLSYLYILTGRVMYLHVAAVASGLLLWNSPPARLIMGDTGSYILGLLITASFMLLSYIPVEVRLLALSFPFVDTITTIVRRLKRRKSIFTADREHIHHVLYSRLGQRWGLVSVMFINLVSIALAHLTFYFGWWFLALGLVWWFFLSFLAFLGPKLSDPLH